MRGPTHLLVLDNLIGQDQQLSLELEQFGARLLGALPGRRPLAHPGPILGRHRVKLMLAGLAAGQNPSGMKAPLGAPTGGFPTLAAQEIEAAGKDLGRGGHPAQEVRADAELAPELAAKGAEGSSHLYLYICI
jgi:hypothetical protein